MDDHPIVLRGCRAILLEIGAEEVSAATSVASGYRAFLRRSPDIVIIDLTFQGDDLGGLVLIKRILAFDKNARILVFSMHNDPSIISRALESGALSYVLKDSSPSELTAALEKVLVGAPYLSHQLAMQVAMLRSKNRSPATQELTSRELQILSLLGQGNSYDKITARLDISYKTVTNACSIMRSKLKVKSLAELIHFAIQFDRSRV